MKDTRDYIKGNKEAWEEAFDRRSFDWGKDVVSRVRSEEYPFFNEETKRVLRKYDIAGKTIGQFCSNNGRETLSLVRSGRAASGVGFDIAQNQVDFANNCAKELSLPCEFIATDIYELEGYEKTFDLVIITIGALCWFRDLDKFFEIVSRTMKENGVIIINESHPMINMLANRGEEGYDEAHPCDCIFSYFEYEWINNAGMGYIVGEEYESKTFVDYTHALSEIMGAMCSNGIVITNFEEYDYDIGVGYTDLDGKGFPLSMIIEGRKL